MLKFIHPKQMKNTKMLNVNLVEKNLLQFIRVERFEPLSIKRVLAILGDMDRDAEVDLTITGCARCRGDIAEICLNIEDRGISTIGEIFDFIEQEILEQHEFPGVYDTLRVTEETILTLGAFFPLTLMSLAIMLEEGIEAAFNYNKTRP